MAKSFCGSLIYIVDMFGSAGYIDLSKRRVSAEEVIKCEEQYEKGKAVDSIIQQVAKKCDVDAERLYESVVWPLGKKYGHAHDAFKLAVT